MSSRWHSDVRPSATLPFDVPSVTTAALICILDRFLTEAAGCRSLLPAAGQRLYIENAFILCGSHSRKPGKKSTDVPFYVRTIPAWDRCTLGIALRNQHKCQAVVLFLSCVGPGPWALSEPGWQRAERRLTGCRLDLLAAGASGSEPAAHCRLPSAC
ncbi:hypothetical protein EYF80_008277 [Liparis tanakae]|uniref:Uncharacterized protein n=1 Tax=Liparis tanakae TaxID=230148 RepID=A0A4Z2IUB4_9TELE|nr:hypothetical protein EYF80_008277 [Liparis tanakae]